MCECEQFECDWTTLVFIVRVQRTHFFFSFSFFATCVLFFLLYSAPLIHTFLGYCCCWEVLSEVRVPSLAKLAFCEKRHTKTVFILSSFFFPFYFLSGVSAFRCASFHSSSKIIQILVLFHLHHVWRVESSLKTRLMKAIKIRE